jgi:hypothetical protein
MIYIVEDIKLLLLLGNRLVMTSWLATLVRRIHVSIFVATIKMYVCVCVYVYVPAWLWNSSSDFSQTWYTYDYNIGINKYLGNAGVIS